MTSPYPQPKLGLTRELLKFLVFLFVIAVAAVVGWAL